MLVHQKNIFDICSSGSLVYKQVQVHFEGVFYMTEEKPYLRRYKFISFRG